MQSVRHQMGNDVGQIVDSVRTLGDWKYYVSKHPWLCLAGAAAIGFLVVPKRPKNVTLDADAVKELAKQHNVRVELKENPDAKNGIVAGAIGLLGNVALRGAMNYLGQNIGKFAGNMAGEPQHEESHP